MKVRKEPTRDIDDALNDLHLSTPQRKRRRRLSGITGELLNASISEENIDNEEPPPKIRKSNRKRTTPVKWNPQNYVTNTNLFNPKTPTEIKNYYLNQTVTNKTTSLETIHEEGNLTEGLNKVMGNKKFRRFLQFDKISKCRMRKRKEKAERFQPMRKTINATLEDLHKKLSLIEDEDC